jgi:hypothetical protein
MEMINNRNVKKQDAIYQEQERVSGIGAGCDKVENMQVVQESRIG